MSWPEGIDMLWIKFLSFVSVFCFANLSCFMIVHIDKKWKGDIISLNLLVISLTPSGHSNKACMHCSPQKPNFTFLT